jgi:uridine kinase
MFLIGIAGGSGSGKTTFATKIQTRVGHSQELAIISQDSYYLPSPPAHLKIHGEQNFDHPEAFDWALLRKHLSELKSGKQIAVPVYDYTVSRRSSECNWVGPCKAVLLEGIFTLWDAELRDLFDIKVFLNVEADIRFIRRLHRDVRERGRSIDSIIRQYYDSVRPMHHEYLEPTRQYADLIVGEETDIAADVIAARVKHLIEIAQKEDPFT